MTRMFSGRLPSPRLFLSCTALVAALLVTTETPSLRRHTAGAGWREFCRLVHKPGNAFTRVAGPPRPRVARDGPGNIAVNYTGFTQQQRTAYQYAVDLAESLVRNRIQLVVEAEMEAMGQGILGSGGAPYAIASPWTFAAGGVQAPILNAFYGEPLANHLMNRSTLDIEFPFHIGTSFNSARSDWYYGTDGLPPANTIDFVSVVLHELTHGLGFAGQADVATTVSSSCASPPCGTLQVGDTGLYLVFDYFTESHDGLSLRDQTAFPEGSAALASQLREGYAASSPRGSGVYLNGARAKHANGGLTARLYTPGTWAGGSSYSHLDEDTYPAGTVNSLMSYALSSAEAVHTLGPVTMGMFADMGWDTCAPTLGALTGVLPRTAGTGSVTLTLPDYCAWTASSQSSFLTRTSSASGTGNTTVAYSFTANSTGSSRTGTITIAGVPYTVTQAAGDTAPTFQTPPSNTTVVAGQNATFTVVAGGDPVPALQWQISTNGGASFSNLSNASPYSGVTTATLTITAASASLNGAQYRAMATNSVASVASDPATLTVLFAPSITTQPASQTVTAGTTAQFTVVVSASPAAAYQWQVKASGGSTFSDLSNASPYSGVTTATLTITQPTVDLRGAQYQVVVTNSQGSTTSSAATLTVNVAPAITGHPLAVSIAAGQNTAFDVAASGTPAAAYQWQISTNGGASYSNLSNAAPYSGVTAGRLTITAAPATLNGARYRAVATNDAGSATSTAGTLTVYGAATVSPGSLRFAATKAGASGALIDVTPAQTVTVTFAGAASSWTASANAPFLEIVNGSGAGAGQFAVRIINPSNVILANTQLSGTVTISFANGPTPSVPISVSLAVDLTGGAASQSAVGQVDTPAQGATGVVGAIGVTGWVVDDVGVTGVKIYRSCLTFENQASCQVIGGHNVVFIGDAAFVAGARPDVESAYAGLPASNVAGWGYLLLTNMLPNVTSQLGFGGQGGLDLYAFATDVEGHVTLLGRTSGDQTPTSITMANNSIAKPFGAIDTPSQGGTVSGTFANFGWVLTPDANTTTDGTDILMATSGSSMRVFIDGVSIGNVTYNQCRGNVGNPVPAGVYCNDDVANIFGNATPQAVFTARMANATLFRNLDAGRAAIGSFDINTSGMTNGVHSIAWGVTDSAGRSEGIGSRNFFVLNSGGDLALPDGGRDGGRVFRPGVHAGAEAPASVGTQHAGSKAPASFKAVQARGPASSLEGLPVAATSVTGRAGFSLATPFTDVAADAAGERHVQIDQMGRVELRLGAGIARGYLVANGTLRDLPAGSHLDVATGTFTWAPAPMYLGAYRLVFLTRSGMEAGSLDPAASVIAGSKDPASIRIAVTIRDARQTPAGEPEIRMHVDTPAADAVVSGRFAIAGWSLDPHAFMGSGIAAVHVWARRLDVPTLGPRFLGAAALGVSRPDVAAVFGAAHHGAGFALTTTLAPGIYEITVYAWNARTARWEDARSVRLTLR